MNLTTLPNDLLYHITHFLDLSSKINFRETCNDTNKNVRYMDIKIEKLNKKFDKLLNGRLYILCRLRLAALCGLHEHTVADIWSWVNSMNGVDTDALPFLREIGRAISKNI
jgi:hypothetical protein